MGREWRVEARRSILHRPPWFEVYQERIRLPGGRLVDDFYAIAIPDFVVVAGFDRDGNVLLERSYRHGARTITWSLPSGYTDPGEEPLSAAKRELMEETGFEATSWEDLGRFVVDGNRGCGWANLFMAEGLRRVGRPNSQDLPEIEVCLLPHKEVLATLVGGGIAELAIAAALGVASVRRNSIDLGMTVAIPDKLLSSEKA